jgi:hypothetical protein
MAMGTQGGKGTAHEAKAKVCTRYSGSVPGGKSQQRPMGDKPKGIGAGGSKIK